MTLALFLAFSALSLAVSAAAALVPVAGVLAVVDLFLAMGLITRNQQGSIFANTNTQPYFWQSVADGITTSGELAGEALVRIFERFFPEDTYYTNGSEYFIQDATGYRPVTVNDVIISASAVTGTAYTIPLNVQGLAPVRYSDNWLNGATNIADLTALVATSGVGYGMLAGQFTDSYGGQYWATSIGAFTLGGTTQAEVVGNWILSPETSSSLVFNVPLSGASWYVGPVKLSNMTNIVFLTDQTEQVITDTGVSIRPTYRNNAGSQFWGYANALFGTSWVYDGKTFTPSAAPIDATVLFTDGVPATTLAEAKPGVDASEIDEGYVVVKPGKDPEPGDDEDEEKHYWPPTPDFWEYLKDWLDIRNWNPLDPDNSSNRGTTLGDYINNNYNYNTVVVEAPEIPDRFEFVVSGRLDHHIDADVNLGGSLNFDIDVNINDNVDLPEVTADDGGAWGDMGVTDVVADITIHNPVFPTLKGLFDAIDPRLRALFLSAVGLSILVGLWKLIRG